MAEFTEDQIQAMVKILKDEFNPDIATRELALLELEDMKRKGCVLEFANRFDECHSCTKALNCPVLTWEKRHPEYRDDELAMRIKVLEAGGEEAYKEKQKRIEEAKKKKAEEEKNKASDEDRVNAARKVCAYLQNAKEPTSAHLFNFIAQSILNAKTKIEIDNAVSMICLDKS